MDRTRLKPAHVAIAVVGILLAVVALVRLGQDQPDGSRTAVARDGAAVAVDIVDFAFAPDPLAVAVGADVTWTNKDSFAHTATATAKTTGAGAPFDSMDLEPGQSYSYRFDTPGTFTYLCAIHNSMTGTVVVQ